MSIVEKTFPASIQHLYEILLWVKKHIDPLCFSNTSIKKVELVVEEIVMNIVRYAYQQKGNISIAIDENQNEMLTITFMDNGIAFNPLDKKSPQIHGRTLENTEEGGLGIFFICRYMDDIQYQRKNGKNILIIRKKRA